MDLDLGEGGLLPVLAGLQAGAGQPLARLLQRVVAALRRGPGIFRAAPLGQRVQDHGQAGRAFGRQVPLQPPRPTQRGLQPHRPVTEPAVIAIRGGPGSFDHLPRQHRQIMQVRAAGRGREQDPVRVGAQVFGQLPGPVADLPRPRRRDLPGRQRGRDHRVGGQPPRPPGRPARRPRRDLRERPQPGLRPVLPVRLEPALGGERRQDLRPRRRGAGPPPAPARPAPRPARRCPDQRRHTRPGIPARPTPSPAPAPCWPARRACSGCTWAGSPPRGHSLSARSITSSNTSETVRHSEASWAASRSEKNCVAANGRAQGCRR